MATTIVTPFQVADCNAALARADIPGHVRLVDACGGQSLELQTDEPVRSEARAVVHAFFAGLGMKARFDAQGRWFTLQ